MIQTIKYKGKNYPYRIGYRALKKVNIELGREFEYNASGMDYEGLEALLYYAMQGECMKSDIEFDIDRKEMEFVLDECLIDVVAGIKAFSQAAEQAAKPQNRQQKRKKS